MKKDIHPKYEKTTVVCACGNSFETKSTGAPTIHVELCSACHPFFTGKQKFVDTAGRVDKFRARVEAAAAKKAAAKPKKEEKPVVAKEVEIAEKIEKTPKQEQVAAVVEEELEQPTAPEQVTQEVTSDEELAAADEIADEESDSAKDTTDKGEHRVSTEATPDKQTENEQADNQ